ncbi:MULTISPECIES: YncE family protein [Bacillaceae]|uniref:YncE family protein n=1 Tax=Bacillaceae TaxID=186817 RepID=UPI001F32DD34|nr:MULTISPECIES: YncE family protein [Bacillaceae]
MSEHLIVLNKDEDTISIVNLDTKEVEKTIATSHNPHEVVVTQDGKKTYVACSLGNKVDIIDNDTFEIVKRIEHPDFNFPHGVGLTKDGKKLYLASTYSEKVFIINTETDEIEKVIPTYQDKSHMISFSPDGNTVYIPNIGSNNITIMDVEKEEITNHIPVGPGPEGVAVHPNGKHLYVANQGDNTYL